MARYFYHSNPKNKKTMKNTLKILGALALSAVLFTACKKDNPVDNDLFVGTYEGSISYLSDDKNVNTDDGRVTVSKVGETYSFAFSDGIPDIKGIRFEKENEEYNINVGGNTSSYIRINASNLEILYIEDGKTWMANCTR